MPKNPSELESVVIATVAQSTNQGQSPAERWNILQLDPNGAAGLGSEASRKAPVQLAATRRRSRLVEFEDVYDQADPRGFFATKKTEWNC